MKNTFLLLTLLLTLQVSAEKGLKAIKAENLITNQGQVSVSYGDYNSDLDNIEVLSSLKFLGKQYVEGSLIVSELENRAYYLVSGNGSAELVVLNAETGAVTKRNQIHGDILSAKIILEKDVMVVINKRTEHNPYGHNSEDISLAFFDLNTGLVKSSTKLDNLSLAVPKATFSGDVIISSQSFSNRTVRLSLSNLVYLPSKEEIVFSATDVLGVNRIYTYDIRRFQLVKSISTDHHIYSMTFNEERNEILALADMKTEGYRSIELGELDVDKGNFESVYSFGFQPLNAQILGGSIDVDPSTNRIHTYVPSFTGSTYHRYGFKNDAAYSFDSNLDKQNTSMVDVEKPLVRSNEPTLTLLNAINVYPNPAVDVIQINRDKLVQVERLELFTISGQKVKDVLVQTNQLHVKMNIQGLEPGVYMLRVSTQTDPVVKRVVVQ
jgi:hypothetical protein